MRMNRSRTALAALMSAALIGAGATTVAPAIADEGAQYAAGGWKKIWNKKLVRYADQRYFTKAQSDAKYSTRTEVGTALGNHWTKAQSDANYYRRTDTYSKAEVDAKLATGPGLIRGTFIMVDYLAAGQIVTGDLSFGQTLNAAPTVNVVPPGGVVPAGCVGGTVASPSAQPGNLCIFQRYNDSTSFTVNTATLGGGASPFGALLLATNDASPYIEVSGSWAVRPVALATGVTAPSSPGGSDGPATSR